jgi:UPF0755 protein
MTGPGDWVSNGRGGPDPRGDRPDYLRGPAGHGDSYVDEDSGSWPAGYDDSGSFGRPGSNGDGTRQPERYSGGQYAPGPYRDGSHPGGRGPEPYAQEEYELYEQDADGTGRYEHDRYRDSRGRDPREPHSGAQYGRDWNGSDPYGQAGSAAPRGQQDAAGRDRGYDSDMAQGWGGLGRHSDTPGGRDGDATSAYQMPGQYGEQDTGAYPRDPYRSGRSGDQASSGTFSWADSGSYDPADSSSYRRPGPGSFDPADSGVFDPADSATFGRPDSGSFARPDSGSFARPETGSSRRPGDGFFDHQETGSASRSASGSFGRRDGEPFSRETGSSGGYGDWQDDRDEQDMWGDGEDDDWSDDDSGLLSRRFGKGDGRGGGRNAGGSDGRGRGPRRRRFRGSAAFVTAMIIVVALLGGAGYFGYKYVHSYIVQRYGDYAGQGSGRVKVVVEAGFSLEQLGPQLQQKGVILALRPYDSAAGRAADASSLQPGTYYLRKHMNSALAVSLLLSGKTRIADTFTVLPDARASDIATNLAKKTHVPVSQFLAIMSHPPASLGLPKWAAGHGAEGFLYPDTYTLAPHESALQILQAMVSDYNTHVGSLGLPSAAPKVFTTPYHVMIVASLIQAEGNGQDFGQVSRVIWNRLQKNMLLEFDSTVFYAMHKYGTSITSAQEKFPSPYNTYLHTGLPPGPIGSPSLAAINAALHPTPGHWLYFITDIHSKTDKTYFATTLPQFQALQAKYGS